MAGDVGNSRRGLDGGLTKEAQAELGLLAISVEQPSVGFLGPARRGVCVDHPAARSRLHERQRSYEKQIGSELVGREPNRGSVIIYLLGEGRFSFESFEPPWLMRAQIR